MPDHLGERSRLTLDTSHPGWHTKGAAGHAEYRLALEGVLTLMATFSLATDQEQATLNAKRNGSTFDLAPYIANVEAMASSVVNGTSKWYKLEFGTTGDALKSEKRSEKRRLTAAAKEQGVNLQVKDDANKPALVWMRIAPKVERKKRQNGPVEKVGKTAKK